MICFKQHYFTIVAIFLSLGLGMVLGSSWLDQELLIQEQMRITRSLEEELNLLIQEREKLGKRLESIEERQDQGYTFLFQVMPGIFQEYFEEKTVALIIEDASGEVKNLMHLLETCGAEPVLLPSLSGNGSGFSYTIQFASEGNKSFEGDVSYWDRDRLDTLDIFRLLWLLREGD